VHILKGQKDHKSMTNATSQTPRKQEQAKPKTRRRREIIKIRAKINEIETKKKKNQQNEKLIL
jgi:uncharacterized protein with WD repeat